MDEKGKGVFESEKEALDVYGVKSLDNINAHFTRRFYDLSLDEQEWWISLEKEIEGKTGLPFEQFRVNYGQAASTRGLNLGLSISGKRIEDLII